jgi:hypothetical protein
VLFLAGLAAGSSARPGDVGFTTGAFSASPVAAGVGSGFFWTWDSQLIADWPHFVSGAGGFIVLASLAFLPDGAGWGFAGAIVGKRNSLSQASGLRGGIGFGAGCPFSVGAGAIGVIGACAAAGRISVRTLLAKRVPKMPCSILRMAGSPKNKG